MNTEQSTLLIVEDDVDVAEMLTAYFRTQGYQVLAVNWGEDAIQTCRLSHPDLVILDIRLPDIDGYEVAHRLRSQQRTKDIPIIFLTELRERANRLQGLEMGADDYITKPFDIQELRLRVRNALHRTSRGPLNNPVTGLAEGALLDERLFECLQNDDWALLLISIQHLTEFRESYGFVASDDVQRAISLMIHNAVRGVGGSNDFIGQLSETDFVIVSQPANLPAVSERIQTRLDQSLEYFYPLKDRHHLASASNRLRIQMGQLNAAEGPFISVEDLKKKLLDHRG